MSRQSPCARRVLSRRPGHAGRECSADRGAGVRRAATLEAHRRQVAPPSELSSSCPGRPSVLPSRSAGPCTTTASAGVVKPRSAQPARRRHRSGASSSCGRRPPSGRASWRRWRSPEADRSRCRRGSIVPFIARDTGLAPVQATVSARVDLFVGVAGVALAEVEQGQRLGRGRGDRGRTEERWDDEASQDE